MNLIFATSTLILSGMQVFLGLTAIAGAVWLGIFAMKSYLYTQSERIRGQHISDSDSPTLRKYAVVSLTDRQGSIKLAGLATSVAIVLIIFAWTRFTNNVVLADFGVEPMEMEIEIPPTTQEKKLPALPPPPKVKSPFFEPTPDPIPEPDPEPDPKPVVSPTPSTYTGPYDTTAVVLPPVIKITPPKRVEKEPEIESVLNMSEFMPMFPGCDLNSPYEEQKVCAEQMMLKWIYARIKYPAQARELGVDGLAVISFVVEKDGSVNDFKIVKDPGAGLGEEAMRIVKLMSKMDKKWIPGRHRGRDVRVRFNLPVRFKLND